MDEVERLLVCNGCEKKLHRISGPVCEKCGKPLVSEWKLCMHCRDRDYAFSQNRSIFEYRTDVKALIRMYKFHGHRGLAAWFSGILQKKINKEYPGSVIVPVPGNPQSKRKRGWDQMQEILKNMDRNDHFEMIWLLKRGFSKQQKELGYKRRCENLRGKISVNNKKLSLDSKILLLDDVFTTGATINECTRVLLSSGYLHISSLTIAID